ncbi:hypothetical protein D3C72_469970 [compost metagenome]
MHISEFLQEQEADHIIGRTHNDKTIQGQTNGIGGLPFCQQVYTDRHPDNHGSDHRDNGSHTRKNTPQNSTFYTAEPVCKYGYDTLTKGQEGNTNCIGDNHILGFLPYFITAFTRQGHIFTETAFHFMAAHQHKIEDE